MKKARSIRKFFRGVQNVIDAIHAKGVSHCDLKRRSNLIVTAQNEIYLVDFAAAGIVGEKPLRFFNNWLQKKMAEIDDKSLSKIKKFAAPENDDTRRLGQIE